MRVLRGLLSICECAVFPFGFEAGLWDLIVLVPDYCLFFKHCAHCLSGPGCFKTNDVVS